MQNFIAKLSNKDNMVDEKELTVCLTFKVLVSHKFAPILNALYDKAKICVDRMLEDRTKKSSKYYKEIPCVLSKSLIVKYQRDKKLKSVKRLVLPICGDKGRQVKIVDGGLRIPAFFKKDVIPVTFPKPIVGHIRQVEFFRREGKWYMSYSYNTPKLQEMLFQGFLGVDRNSVGNVVAIADAQTGHCAVLGIDSAGLTKNWRNRRRKLQKKGAKYALTKIRRKQSRRIKDINHKVSRSVVDYAREHRLVIVLEDLGKIAKRGKAKRYVQKSQWSFYQLETFIKYKAALSGVPVVYVDPAYTSQKCSRCGTINKVTGKQYKCSCGHFSHRDCNAAFNISVDARVLYEKALGEMVPKVRCIGDPLNQRSEKALQLESSGGA